MARDNLAWLAVAPCGCACAVNCEAGADADARVRAWRSEGRTVTRVRLDDAMDRLGDGHCPHTPQWGRPR